jgi:hypothetical protein
MFIPLHQHGRLVHLAEPVRLASQCFRAGQPDPPDRPLLEEHMNTSTPLPAPAGAGSGASRTRTGSTSGPRRVGAGPQAHPGGPRRRHDRAAGWRARVRGRTLNRHYRHRQPEQLAVPAQPAVHRHRPMPDEPDLRPDPPYRIPWQAGARPPASSWRCPGTPAGHAAPGHRRPPGCLQQFNRATGGQRRIPQCPSHTGSPATTTDVTASPGATAPLMAPGPVASHSPADGQDM